MHGPLQQPQNRGTLFLPTPEVPGGPGHEHQAEKTTPLMLGDSGGAGVSDPGEEDRIGLGMGREAEGADTGALRRW